VTSRVFSTIGQLASRAFRVPHRVANPVSLVIRFVLVASPRISREDTLRRSRAMTIVAMTDGRIADLSGQWRSRRVSFEIGTHRSHSPLVATRIARYAPFSMYSAVLFSRPVSAIRPLVVASIGERRRARKGSSHATPRRRNPSDDASEIAG